MDAMASVGNVGAGLSEAQFRVQYQIQMLKEQQKVQNDLGAAALELIQSVLAGARTQAHGLDVLA